MHPLPSLAAALALLILTAWTSSAALALDCQAATERELQRLGVAAGDVASILYVQKYNPTKRGPEVLGVRAWIRLKACSSGYLVVDMTRSCLVRQSYTRGDCRLDGVSAY